MGIGRFWSQTRSPKSCWRKGINAQPAVRSSRRISAALEHVGARRCERATVSAL